MSPEQTDLLPGGLPTSACCKSAPFNPHLPPKQRVPRKAAGRGRALSQPGDTCASIQVEAASLSCWCEPWSCTSGAEAGTVPGSTFGCVLVLGTPQIPFICAQAWLPAAALTCVHSGSEVCAPVTSGLALFKALCTPGPACRIRT